MSAEADERGTERTARIAIGAVAILAALVIGTLVIDSLKRNDHDEPAVSAEQTDAPLATGISSSSPKAEPAPTGGSGHGIPSLEEWRRLLAKDPRAAAVSVAQMPADDDRDARLTELMVHWTAKSPGAAGDWLLEQPLGEFRTDSSVEFSRAWADRDPVAAAGWVSARDDNPAAVDAIGGILARWTPNDPEAARDWAESLTSPAARETAGTSLAYTWVQKDARAASEWVGNMKDPALRASASRHLVNAWSATDPASAARWLSTNLSEPSQRDAAALPLILTWADNDPRAASQWVAALPGGQLQERSKSIFAEALAEEAPRDALAWAESIGEPDQRNDSILNIYESWMETDKPALLTHLRDNLQTAPVLRDKIYDMLYEHDPEFRAELIGLYENNENTAP